MQFTTAEFIASVRETYEEMQQLHKQVHGDNVTYPDFEAAMSFVEQRGLPDAISLEKQYAKSLGRLAQLCDICIPWVLNGNNHDNSAPADVITSAREIMEYVDAVRP